MTIKYPPVQRDEEFEEILHGRKVPDPYRWLEDPESSETKAFLEAQNRITDEYFSRSDTKEKFQQSLTALWNYEKHGCPERHGNAYYYFHNMGLQPQNILYKQSSLDAKPEVFFDPNKLSDDGTVALNTYSFSEEGTYFGYALSKSGSDWVTIHVKCCSDGQDLIDKIEFAKFTSIGWTIDETGFFYHRYPEVDAADLDTETNASLNSMLCYHRVGTSQTEDVLIYADPSNPTFMFSAQHSDCGEYVIMSTAKDCYPVNLLWISKSPKGGKFTNETTQWTKIVDEWIGQFSYLTNKGPVFYFKTNWNAPKYRVVKYDLTNRSAGFQDIIPESSDVLEFATLVDNDKLLVSHLRDVQNTISIYYLIGGKMHDLPLPVPGTIDNISHRRQDSTFFYRLTSFLCPGTIYQFDIKAIERKGATEKSSNYGTVFKITTLAGFNSDEFYCEQIFYESKDGTKIPMFLVMKKGLQRTGLVPTFLYGYGGFSELVKPYFNPSFITFVKYFNGLVAIPNIRGGGEYGEDWHKQGMLNNKQNVFDDFQYAAKYLVKEGWTSHSKIAINGGSNGGLLVGACINQAPELFGAAVAEVGVYDMLRFHKFTIGHAWTSDYGNPDDKSDFECLMKYSPYHNVQNEKLYPSTLLMTSDHDNYAVPLHSYKYLAQLQYKCPNNLNPLLMRIEVKAGHYAGKSTQQQIEFASYKFAFIAAALGLEWIG